MVDWNKDVKLSDLLGRKKAADTVDESIPETAEAAHEETIQPEAVAPTPAPTPASPAAVSHPPAPARAAGAGAGAGRRCRSARHAARGRRCRGRCSRRPLVQTRALFRQEAE